MTGRLVVALATDPAGSGTVAALRLADAALTRGLDVTVFAYGDGVEVAAPGGPTASYVEELLVGRPSGGRGELTWIVDARDPRSSRQVDGVTQGDGVDLWRGVCEGDVVLGVTA